MSDLQGLCCLDDFEKKALQKLPQSVAGYYKSGACSEYCLEQNEHCFRRLKIRPRMLRNASIVDTSTTVQGKKVPVPIGVAPTAMQKLAHPDGEIGNAKAAGNLGSVFILSTLSTTSVEELASQAPDVIKWLQLYIYKNRELTKSFVKRAEKQGFEAIVLTVDASQFGTRYADVRNQFCLPPYLSLENFTGESATVDMNDTSISGISDYVLKQFDPSISWDDIAWLKQISKLPVILKGILTAEDAIMALKAGVSGIIVSNHGGRQSDSWPSSIEALPEIAKAVGHKIDVYMDGGVRFGTDVFKAIALGAKMVFVGRPVIWGLTCGGQQGVEKVLTILQNEFRQTMALSGCSSLKAITPEMVVHENYYSKL